MFLVAYPLFFKELTLLKMPWGPWVCTPLSIQCFSLPFAWLIISDFKFHLRWCYLWEAFPGQICKGIYISHLLFFGFFLVLLKIWSCFGCLLIICYSTLEFNLLQGRDLMCLIHPLPSAVPGRQHTYFFPKTFMLHHTAYRILVPLPVIKPRHCGGSSESQWLDHQGGSTAGS